MRRKRRGCGGPEPRFGVADRVLYVQDATRVGGRSPAELAAELEELPPDVALTLVFNKIDLTGAAAHETHGAVTEIFLSAKTGAGLDLLRAHLRQSAGYRDSESGALAARRRHLDALKRAQALVQSAAEVLRRPQAFELFAEDLRLAQCALGEITGEFTSEDLLGAIFGSFCIGK